MPNIHRGEGSFDVDGVTYRLVVDLNAMAEAEEASALQLDDLLAALSPVVDKDGKVIGKPRLKHVGALLYGALRAHHPDVTLAAAINLLGAGEHVGAAIGKALVAALPKAQAKSAEGKVDAGTGTKPRPTGRRRD